MNRPPSIHPHIRPAPGLSAPAQPSPAPPTLQPPKQPRSQSSLPPPQPAGTLRILNGKFPARTSSQSSNGQLNMPRAPPSWNSSTSGSMGASEVPRIPPGPSGSSFAQSLGHPQPTTPLDMSEFPALGGGNAGMNAGASANPSHSSAGPISANTGSMNNAGSYAFRAGTASPGQGLRQASGSLGTLHSRGVEEDDGTMNDFPALPADPDRIASSSSYGPVSDSGAQDDWSQQYSHLHQQRHGPQQQQQQEQHRSALLGVMTGAFGQSSIPRSVPEPTSPARKGERVCFANT